MALWLAGCLWDFYNLELWNLREPAMWLMVVSFTVGGPLIIWGVSKGIGWMVRRFIAQKNLS